MNRLFLFLSNLIFGIVHYMIVASFAAVAAGVNTIGNAVIIFACIALLIVPFLSVWLRGKLALITLALIFPSAIYSICLSGKIFFDDATASGYAIASALTAFDIAILYLNSRSLRGKVQDSQPSTVGLQDKEILDYGISLAMEFGESWLQPIQSRLGKKFPELSPSELNRYNEICQSALKLSHDVVYKFAECHGNTIEKSDFEARLHQEFPWISQENLSRLLGQGVYYAWKDGLLK